MWMRRAGQIIGGIVSLYWIVALGGHLFVADEHFVGEHFPGEGILVVVLVSVNILGVILAWRNSMSGTALLILGGVLLSVFACVSAGRNEWLAVLVSGVPFLVSAVLFWFGNQHLQRVA